ncbi:MAG TPA: hypothetical protein VFF73_11010 [Planctomycetota bacterium]|nr:hypothetical protein [Planctomycetota bacterium]
MRLSIFLGIISVALGALYGKLLHDREVQLARAKVVEGAKPKPDDAPPPPPPPPVTKLPKKDDDDRTPLLTPTEERTLAPARDLLARGRFDECARAARDVSGGKELELGARQLAERAQLYSVLTKALVPSPFVDARDLVRVTLLSNITHTACVVHETDAKIELKLADGRDIELDKERIVKREPYPRESWESDMRADLEKKKASLAKDSGALEVYHVACDAFEMGLRDAGVTLLQRSLGLEGGDAVIDVYGFGDLELLHRAQHRIRAEALASNPELAMAQPRRPRSPRARPVETAPPPPPSGPIVSDVPPKPEVDSPVETPPSPPTASPVAPPTPQPPPPMTGMDFGQLEADGRWKDAHEAYKEGVDLYKAGFKGITASEKQRLKDARTSLEKARELLDALPQEMTQDAAQSWDSFSARVNEILRAVKKQMAATGS